MDYTAQEGKMETHKTRCRADLQNPQPISLPLQPLDCKIYPLITTPSNIMADASLRPCSGYIFGGGYSFIGKFIFDGKETYIVGIFDEPVESFTAVDVLMPTTLIATPGPELFTILPGSTIGPHRISLHLKDINIAKLVGTLQRPIAEKHVTGKVAWNDHDRRHA